MRQLILTLVGLLCSLICRIIRGTSVINGKITQIGNLLRTIASLSVNGIAKIIILVYAVYFSADEIVPWITGEDNNGDVLHIILERLDANEEVDDELRNAFIESTHTQELMQRSYENHINFLHE